MIIGSLAGGPHTSGSELSPVPNGTADDLQKAVIKDIRSNTFVGVGGTHESGHQEDLT